MRKVLPLSSVQEGLAERHEPPTLMNRIKGPSQALLNAISNNDISEVSRILNTASININETISRFGIFSSSNVTPLCYAIHKGLPNDNSDIVQLLLEHGADPNIPSVTDITQGYTTYPIFLAIKDRYSSSEQPSKFVDIDADIRLKIIKLLVENPINPARLDVTIGVNSYHSTVMLTPLKYAETYSSKGQIAHYLRSITGVTIRGFNVTTASAAFAPSGGSGTPAAALPGAGNNSFKGGRRNKSKKRSNRSKRKTRSKK